MDYQSIHLDPGENVLLEVRKHWIVFAGNALVLFFGALLPLAVYTILQIFVPNILKMIVLPGNGAALVSFLYILWVLFLWIIFFIEWTVYYFDVWFVTEKRIIDVDQKRLFNRDVTNLRFDKIQDVSVDVRGMISTFLDFGNVRVSTAAENEGDFVMTTIRHPDRVRKIIFSRHNEVGDIPLEHARANTPENPSL